MAVPPAIPPDPDIDRPKGMKSISEWKQVPSRSAGPKGINTPNLLKSVKTGDKSRPKRYRRVLLQQGSAIAAIIGIVLLVRYFGFISDSVSLIFVSLPALVVGGILSRSGKAGAAIGFTVVILLLGVGFGLPFLEVYAAPLEPVDNAFGITSTAGFALEVVDNFAERLLPESEVIPGTATGPPVEASPGLLQRSIAVAVTAIVAALYAGISGGISGIVIRSRMKGDFTRDTRAPKIESPEPWSGPDDIEGGPTAGTGGSHDFSKNE